MQKPNLIDVSSTSLSAAIEAGDLIRNLRERGQVDISFKSEKDLVTNADLQAEAIIMERVRERFPDHAFLTEESAPTVNPATLQGPLWVIDPIDGTTNYAHGHTQVAVSIAFCFEGKVLSAVVHAPFQHETFQAVMGGGATLNGRSIAPRPISELKLALVATGYPGWRTSADYMIQQTHAVLTHCRDIRRLGSAALDICWVASGRLDGYWESIKPWDLAAAALIAREAGALTGSIVPRPQSEQLPQDLYGDNFIVSTPDIFEKLRKILDLPRPK